MAASADPLHDLDDITECPICTERFTDPRLIPCVHTYCLECIRQHCRGKGPGQAVPCPMCRKDFVIPDNGLDDLPRNFFMEKLMSMRTRGGTDAETETRVDGPTCDLCGDGDEDSAAGGSVVVIFYCSQCQQNFCEQCSTAHRRIKSLATHQLVEVRRGCRENQSVQVIGAPSDSPAERCDVHAERSAEILCHDCVQVLCMLCYYSAHNSHRCADLHQAAELLTEQLASDANDISERTVRCRTDLRKLEMMTADIVQQTADAEKQINDTTDSLITLVLRQKEELMDRLRTAKSKMTKELGGAREDVERQLVMLESFSSRHLAEINCVPKAGELPVKAIIGLRQKIRELTSVSDVTGHETGSVPEVQRRIAFIASGLSEVGSQNLIGRIDVTENANHPTTDVSHTASLQLSAYGNGNTVTSPAESAHSIARLTSERNAVRTQPDTVTRPSASSVALVPASPPAPHITAPGRKVCGVTSLSDEVFVMRKGSRDVEAYDVDTLTLRRRLPVAGLGPSPSGIASCSRHGCIYIADHGNSVVHRLQANAAGTAAAASASGCGGTTRWKVPRQPSGVSVSVDDGDGGTLVVTSYGENALVEYSTGGHLLRDVRLSPSITGPEHAVRLTGGQFVVSHSGPVHGVSVVDQSGRLVRRFDQSMTTTTGFSYPKGLAVAGDGASIFVADQLNDRVVVVDVRLTTLRALTDVAPLRGPYGVCLDESRDRMYVAEWTGGKVSVWPIRAAASPADGLSSSVSLVTFG